MTKLNIINCSNEKCSKEFKQRKPTSQYCSVECVKEVKNSKNPLDRICLNKDCKQQFSVQRRSDKKKYCSRSCATISNNLARSHETKISGTGFCKTGIKISDVSIYCKSHYKDAQRDIKIQKWIDGEWDGNQKGGLSQTIRNYLLEQANYACEKCGFNKRHPDDGKTILEINHIDGDAFNSWFINPNNVDKDDKSSNLEVVCPNCHALSSNYRARNIGKSTRVDRYPDSKIKEVIKEKERKLKEAQELLLSTGNKIDDIKNLLNKDICECGNLKMKESTLCFRCSNKRYNASGAPSKQELIDTINQFNHNYTRVAKHYKTTPTTIRRWCKKYGINRVKN